MPRSRGGGGGRPAARPTAAPPPRPAAPQQQTRPASTAAHPNQAQNSQANAQQGQRPGLFGQMASTAAGVAVGSSIGHAVGGWFGGGSQAAAPADEAVAQDQTGQYAMNQNYQGASQCQPQITQFKQCMDQQNGDLNICGWYLDQLKMCQQAASQY